MGSSEKSLNPEAKPWQPFLKSPHQSHFYYYYYPFNHTPVSDHRKSRTIAAGPVLHYNAQYHHPAGRPVLSYNLQNQPTGGSGGRSKSHGWSAPVADKGRKEVVTYKWSVGQKRRTEVKEKGCERRRFGWVRKKGVWSSAQEMPDAGGKELGPNVAVSVDDVAGAGTDTGTDTATGGRTTVMIRNIPNQFRRDMLLAFLDDYCVKYNLEYDFVYLPMDFRSLDNLGYAFVNFTSASAAQKIREVLTNYKWGLIGVAKGFVQSNKTCLVTWARLQGKQELVNNFSKSFFSCYTYDYLPVVLDPPRNGSNSASTKSTPIGRCRQLPMLAKQVTYVPSVGN